MNILSKFMIFLKTLTSNQKKGMTCKDASLLIANIDDLETSVKEEVLAHVSDCPCCGNYLDQIVFLNKKCKEINKLDIQQLDTESLSQAKLDIINKFCSKDKSGK